MTDEPSMGQPYGTSGGAGPTESAGLGARIGARLLDVLLIGIPASFVLALVGLADPTGASPIIISLLWYGYFVLLESNRGATVGKSILGIRVVSTSGGTPEIAETAKRNVWMLLGLIPFVGGIAQLVAVIAIIVTISSAPDDRGWHDGFAGTSVLRAA